MIGMILAAGLGTRLRPLTDHLPKPAVPVANRALVGFAVERLRDAGITSLRANGHHLAPAMRDALRALDPGLGFFAEQNLLGTGGGLYNALHDADDEVVVINGDVLFDVDVRAAIAAHRAHDAFATMVVRPDPRAEAMGAVRVSADGLVRMIAGKPDVRAEGTEAFAFSGVHVLSRRALRALPEEGCIVRRGYHRWLEAGERVLGVVDGGRWADLGTHAAYLEANVALATGGWPWPGITHDIRGIVHETARVKEASITASVVGDEAIVDPGVSLERCVVWPNAHVTTSARDAIITPFGIVAVG